jgi:peroxiredoxin family protein/TusA-related sulfurtransferase/rhodanese-related sulfurtransferase
VRPLANLPNDQRPLILDVRAEAIAHLHPIPDSVNIPMEQIRSRIEEIEQLAPEGREIITVCNVGKTSYFASRILAQHGFNVYSLLGGAQLLHAKKSAASFGASIAPSTSSASATVTSEANAEIEKKTKLPKAPLELDACGLACPGPILEINKMIPKLVEGQQLTVRASDPGFANDFPAFVKLHSHEVELVGNGVEREKGIFTGRLRKKSSSASSISQAEHQTGMSNTTDDAKSRNGSIIVFSSEMDKVLAALVIANGIVAAGGEVTMFFTFWGLSALRKEKVAPGSCEDADRKKSLLDAAMGAMLPQGFKHLGLSHMNFGGLGAKLMEHTMQKKHLPELPGLIKSAVESGKVRFVACTMSMEALGIKECELMENVELGGVADFLASARSSGTTLFI